MNTPLSSFRLLAVTGALCIFGPQAQSAAAPSDVSAALAAPALAPLQDGTRIPALPATAALTITFAIKGMTCGGCVIGTRTVLTRLPGVTKADVSYEKGTAVVTYDPHKVTVEQMVAAIKTLGYTATVLAN